MEVLAVKGLSKSFGGVRAVSDVGFSIEGGKLLALIGPNGAGKTTCFNLLNGQLKADTGTVLLAGKDITGMSPRAIWEQGVGRTFQITQTFSSMTVRENVQMALISHHGKPYSVREPAASLFRDEALELLKSVDMQTHAERSCAILAYGDLKRVELAIALANSPKLLLMDEPTAGMAPRERMELMALTAEIVAARGISVLFTEHDMDIVFKKADSILVLDRGKVIAQGTPGEVRDDPLVKRVYLGGGSMFAQ